MWHTDSQSFDSNFKNDNTRFYMKVKDLTNHMNWQKSAAKFSSQELLYCHGCPTADHQAHGATWFRHSQAPLGILYKVWLEHHFLIPPIYTGLTPKNASATLCQINWRLHGRNVANFCISVYLEVDLRNPRGTGVSSVSSNTWSMFLWKRAISSEKSFSTSAQLHDWWSSWRHTPTFLAHRAKRSSSGTA